MYSHIRGPLQHWIADRASGFQRDIVGVFGMYSTDISAINLSWSSYSQTVPITSLPPFSSNDYHQLFPFSGRSTRSPLVLAAVDEADRQNDLRGTPRDSSIRSENEITE